MRHKFEAVVPVTDEEWEEVMKGCHEISFPRRTVFARPGAVFNRMYYLQKGVARTYYIDEKGEEKTIFFHVEDNWVTEYMSFTKELPASFYFETIEPCTFSFFYRKDVYNLYKALPKFLQFHLATAEGEFSKMFRRMVQFYMDDLETRHQKLTEEFPQLFQRVPQHMIASYLGVKPQSLSRMVAAMKNK